VDHIVKRDNPVVSRSTLTHFSDGQQPAYTQPLQHGELTENSIDRRAGATSPLHVQHCDNASVHLLSPVPLATTAWGQQSASALAYAKRGRCYLERREQRMLSPSLPSYAPRPAGTIFALVRGRRPRTPRPLASVSWRSAPPRAWRFLHSERLCCLPPLTLNQKEALFS